MNDYNKLKKLVPDYEFSKLVAEACITAFDHMDKIEKRDLLKVAEGLKTNRTRPLTDNHKIELLGKIGLYLNANFAGEDTGNG